ncbi:MAG: DUF2281 domain-containing protein [Chloroflexi bacterium]|nr:DUF2281 domain-containing protein [Chloroflexota bacterium]MCC6897188.1 DUF2281 domain-containing protein [Anaerolineae bacterium]
MLQINVHDKNFKLDDLIQAAKRGEEVVIVTDEQERFKLVQVEAPKRLRKLGAAKGQFSMSDDFNAPIDDFDEYT